jgi:RNA polymerase sigma factor (sigma-70 family)
LDAANARLDGADGSIEQVRETGVSPAGRVPTRPGDWADLAEPELLRMSRAGHPEAFAELFRRHRSTAVRVAARTSRDLDPEDVAAEAFARVWSALSRGRGPDHAFRPYLVAAVRNVALNRCRGNRELTTDPAMLPEPETEPDGMATAMAEAHLICAAFASLPERWQRALWATEVEEQPMAEFARSIGVSSNSASALCLRARDGLKSAWLQAHVNRSNRDPECEWTLARLGAHARDRLPAGQRKRVDAHLAECESCPLTLSRLAFIGRSLKVAVLFAGGAGGSILAVKAAAGAAVTAGTGTLLVAQPAPALVGLVSGWARSVGQHVAGIVRDPMSLLTRGGARVALAAAGVVATAVTVTVAVAAMPPGNEVAGGEPLALQVLAPASVGGSSPSASAPAPTDEPVPSAAPGSGRRVSPSASRPANGRSVGASGRVLSASPSPPVAPSPDGKPSVSPTAPGPSPSAAPSQAVSAPAVATTPAVPSAPSPALTTAPTTTPSLIPQPSPAPTPPSLIPQPSPEPTASTPTPSPGPTSTGWSPCPSPPAHGPHWPLASPHRPHWCPIPGLHP